MKVYNLSYGLTFLNFIGDGGVTFDTKIANLESELDAAEKTLAKMRASKAKGRTVFVNRIRDLKRELRQARSASAAGSGIDFERGGFVADRAVQNAEAVDVSILEGRTAGKVSTAKLAKASREEKRLLKVRDKAVSKVVAARDGALKQRGPSGGYE